MAMITAQLIQELRKRTGAGMMECKSALSITNGDIELAVIELRKRGVAKADKKADRVAAEGVIILHVVDDGHAAVMLEANCETDFVARDENFKHFAEAAAIRALETESKTLEDLFAKTLLDGMPETIEQTRQALIGKIGENVQLRRLVYMFSNQNILGTYLHGHRIGVIVEMQGGSRELAKDIAMHIAASNPKVINSADVPQDLIDKEKEIAVAQAKDSGKPVNIIEKMVAGRISKFVEEVSLVGQAFVKNPEITVAKLLQQHNAQVKKFVRFEVGEGIEKKSDDFVAEVMAQAKAAANK